MKGFCRMTKLTNVGGRADYIRDPDRQEEVVVSSEPIDWQPYHEYEVANQKSDRKNNEGRELIISIPNEWYTTLSRKELFNRVEQIVYAAVGKKTDVEWAVHWNKRRTNLHIHAVFSERSRIKDPGKWDRNIYLTNDGRVARKKADRATFENGVVKPPVHRKGDLKEPFTAKDKAYKRRTWLKSTKETVKTVLQSYGAVIDKDGFVHQYHEGKGSEAKTIIRKNNVIKANNDTFDRLIERYPGIDKALKKPLIAAANNFKVLSADEMFGLLTRSEQLKAVFEGFKASRKRIKELGVEISECGFWQKAKKTELEAQLHIAFKEADTRLAEVYSFDEVSNLNFTRSGYGADLGALERDVSKAISRIEQQKVDRERDNLRFSGSTMADHQLEIQKMRDRSGGQTRSRSNTKKKDWERS